MQRYGWVRADEAEAERAALRAEVELLKTQERNAGKLAVAHAEARWTSESCLSAATELLREWVTEEQSQTSVFQRSKAFIAAQPAAPAGAETELGRERRHVEQLLNDRDTLRAEVERLRTLNRGLGTLAEALNDALINKGRKDEPAAPSLGHPGADEVFERLQAARQPAAPARTEAEPADDDGCT